MPPFRLICVLILGFSSGLPLALTGSTLQAWLAVENVDIKTIGLYAVVGFPYTYKFLWSPFLDYLKPGFFDQRRGWIALTSRSPSISASGSDAQRSRSHPSAVRRM